MNLGKGSVKRLSRRVVRRSPAFRRFGIQWSELQHIGVDLGRDFGAPCTGFARRPSTLDAMFIGHLPAGYLVAAGVSRGRPRARSWWAAALVGSVFPDLDLFYFCLLDGQPG